MEAAVGSIRPMPPVRVPEGVASQLLTGGEQVSTKMPHPGVLKISSAQLDEIGKKIKTPTDKYIFYYKALVVLSYVVVGTICISGAFLLQDFLPVEDLFSHWSSSDTSHAFGALICLLGGAKFLDEGIGFSQRQTVFQKFQEFREKGDKIVKGGDQEAITKHQQKLRAIVEVHNYLRGDLEKTLRGVINEILR